MSLLCKECKIDKDEELLVICDTCNNAYHIYCMENILAEVPSEEWFCHICLGKKSAENEMKLEALICKEIDYKNDEKKNDKFMEDYEKRDDKVDDEEVFLKFAWKKRKINYAADDL